MEICLENLPQGRVYLYQIIDLLTCRMCNHFLNNAISLPCLHRFCERCVFKKFKREGEKLPCITCSLEIENRTDIRQQSQLNMYIVNLKKMFELLHKVDKSAEMDDLYDYVMYKKSWSEMSYFKKEDDSRTNEERDIINDKTVPENDDMHFTPQLCSTVYKMPKDNSFARGNMTRFNSGDIVVDETKTDSFLESSFNNSIYNASTQDDKSEHLTTTIEQLSQVEMTQLDPPKNVNEEMTINDSQEMPMSFSSQEELDIVGKDDVVQLLNTSENNTYQTQSQIHVLKQPITYSHRAMDKFDQIVQTTNTTTELKFAETCQTENSLHQSSVLNNSAYSFTRSDSPVLELFGNDDYYDDDDDLMCGILKY